MNFDRPLAVQRQMAVELMAGAQIISCGWRLANVPTAVPWDIKDSPKLDVIQWSRELISLARLGYLCLVWLGTVCKSFTVARSPRVRSVACPWGLSGLTDTESVLVETGNALAFFSATMALFCTALAHTLQLKIFVRL